MLLLIYDRQRIYYYRDCFDPSILPSTGTPEPGGLLWYWNPIFEKIPKKKKVGFDIVELCPNPAEKSSDFLAAKLLQSALLQV